MERLLAIKKTQLEMVKDRGYIVTPEEEGIFNMTVNQFTEYVTTLAGQVARSPRSVLSRFYESRDPTGKVVKTILVYYGSKDPAKKQVSAEVVRDFIQTAQKYTVTEAVLIVDTPLSSTGTSELNALTLIKWQVFFDDKMTFNPTRHIDTPKHILVPDDQKTEKLRELKVSLAKLPIIRLDDPIVRYYGWSLGQLIKIERYDRGIPTIAPESIQYRVVAG